MAFKFECNIMVLLLWVEQLDEINMFMFILHCKDKLKKGQLAQTQSESRIRMSVTCRR